MAFIRNPKGRVVSVPDADYDRLILLNGWSKASKADAPAGERGVKDGSEKTAGEATKVDVNTASPLDDLSAKSREKVEAVQGDVAKFKELNKKEKAAYVAVYGDLGHNDGSMENPNDHTKKPGEELTNNDFGQVK